MLDLNGHVLSNNGGGAATTAQGIEGHDHRDITVKNGTVRLFRDCVLLQETFPANDNRTLIVEDLKIENCRHIGMSIMGQSSTVRRNVVRDTGNSEDATHWGMLVDGQGSQVLDNLVHHVAGTDAHPSIGIEVGELDITVVNNRVSGVGQGIVFDASGTSGVPRQHREQRHDALRQQRHRRRRRQQLPAFPITLRPGSRGRRTPSRWPRATTPRSDGRRPRPTRGRVPAA